jgi:prophage maintenance system killer protein
MVLNMRFLKTAHEILEAIFQDDEPIPAWEEGHTPTLEMCCGCTEVEAFGHQKYPDLPSKCAKLFYATIKNHPFPNGNKRFALVLTLGYIAWNDHRLTSAEGVGYEVATSVADSDPHTPEGDPDVVIANLAEFFRDNIEPFNWPAYLKEQGLTQTANPSEGET